jgi:cell division protein FtsB
LETHTREEIRAKVPQEPEDASGRGRGFVAMPKRFQPKVPLIQAYSQAPWRIETQRGVLLLIVAILGASILWVMVSVTVQAASAGLEIQQLETEREDLEREIAGKRTDIANLTSAAVMKERAKKLGFEPVDPASVIYFVAEGFSGREAVISAPTNNTEAQQQALKPAYTQSLWEWLLQGILDIGESPGQFLKPGGTAP